MPYDYEIKITPAYTGNTGGNTYKWLWYIWNSSSTYYNVETDLVRVTTGTAPDVTPLLITTTPPTIATIYNIQLVVKNIDNTVACSSLVQQITVQPSICDGVCVTTAMSVFHFDWSPSGDTLTNLCSDVTATNTNATFNITITDPFSTTAGVVEFSGATGSAAAHLQLNKGTTSTACADSDLCMDGEFTIDMWFQTSSTGGMYGAGGLFTGASAVDGFGTGNVKDFYLVYAGLAMGAGAAGTEAVGFGYPAYPAAYIAHTPNLALNTWHHFAFTRDLNDDCRIFVDGVQRDWYHNVAVAGLTGVVGPTVSATGTFDFDQGHVGGIGHSMFPAQFDGYIDDLRIIKGVAEWCTGFTAPALPHTCVMPNSCVPIVVPGCTQKWADNWNPWATQNDGSCVLAGCQDEAASNFDPAATTGGVTCVYTNVSLFHLDGNITQSCAPGVSATATNVTWTSATGGKFANAASFTGATGASQSDITLSSSITGAASPLYCDGEFTVDFWFQTSSTGGPAGMNGAAGFISGASAYDGGIFVNPSDTAFYMAYSGLALSGGATGSEALFLGTKDFPYGYQVKTPNLAINTWHHFALTRDANDNARMFLDGTQQDWYWHPSVGPGGTATGADTIIGPVLSSVTGAYDFDGAKVGSQAHTMFPAPLEGYIDELRIVKGSSQWCDDFTAPTAAHTCVPPTSAICAPVGTVSLFHLDGDITETCSSGVSATATNTIAYATGQFTNAFDFNGLTGSIGTPSGVLLHFNGTSGATGPITDSGATGANSVISTAVGNVHFNTSVYSPASGNTSSVRFDGDGDYIKIDDNTLFHWDGEFTLDMWVRFDNITTHFAGSSGGHVQVVLDEGSREIETDAILNAMSITQKFRSDSLAIFKFAKDSPAPAPMPGAWTIVLGTDDVGWDVNWGAVFHPYHNQIIWPHNGGTAALADNTWYHFALTRDSNNDIRAFQDGVMLTDGQNLYAAAASGGPTPGSTGVTAFNYSGTFSPTGFVYSSTGTVSLFHFDGTTAGACSSPISVTGANVTWSSATGGKFANSINFSGSTGASATTLTFNVSGVTAGTTSCADNPLCLDGAWTVDFWLKLSGEDRHITGLGGNTGTITEICNARQSHTLYWDSDTSSYQPHDHFGLIYDGGVVGAMMGNPAGHYLLLAPFGALDSSGHGLSWHKLESSTGADVNPEDNWHHIAVTRDSNFDNRVFFDGALTTYYEGGATAVGTYFNSMIGGHSGGQPWRQMELNGLAYGLGDFLGAPFSGEIDELRIVKGAAEWTSNFTAPTGGHTCTSLISSDHAGYYLGAAGNISGLISAGDNNPNADGATSIASTDLKGYIDEFRAVKGTAKWTSGFTAPAAPYNNTTDISALVNANTTLTFDVSGVTAGTPCAANPLCLDEAYTIDFWIKLSSATRNAFGSDTTSTEICVAYPYGEEIAGRKDHLALLYADAVLAPVVGIGSGSGQYMMLTTFGRTVEDGVWAKIPSDPVGTWCHMAITRDSSFNVRLFWNGVALEFFEGSTSHGYSYTGITGSDSSNGYLHRTTRLDSLDWGNKMGMLDFPFNGAIDEFRVVKGQSEWCADFTSPTGAARTCDVPSSCSPPVLGCTEEWANNYSSTATENDGSCYRHGCTTSWATNYDALATIDNGSCVYDSAVTTLFHMNGTATAEGCSNVISAVTTNVTWTSDTGGKFANAAGFTGATGASQSDITISSSTGGAASPLYCDGEFTVDFWFQTSSTGGPAGLYGAAGFISGASAYDALGGTTPKDFYIAYSGLALSSGATGSEAILFGTKDFPYGYQVKIPNLAINTWHHLALTRDANDNARIFVDGTQRDWYWHPQFGWDGATGADTIIGPVLSSVTGAYDFDGAKVGAAPHQYFPAPLEGYIDELRIIKGAAEWCSDFTVPATAHGCTAPASDICSNGAISLFHFDGTTAGACSSPISATGANVTWSSATGGKFANSINFSGLTGASATTLTFNVPGVVAGTTPCANNPLCFDGEYTVDFWVKLSSDERPFAMGGTGSHTEICNAKQAHTTYYNSDNSAYEPIDHFLMIYDGGFVGAVLGFPAGHYLLFNEFGRTDNHGGMAWFKLESSTGADLNPEDNWHHIAVTRDSNFNNRFFFDGRLTTYYGSDVDGATAGGTYFTSITGGHSGGQPWRQTELNGLVFGTAPFLGAPFNGEIDELRIVKGSSEWCADFTLPTAVSDCTVPISSVCGIVSLFHFDGGTAVACSSGVTASTANVTYTSATGGKFANAISFVGLTGASASNMTITASTTGTNGPLSWDEEFTIDFWIKFDPTSVEGGVNEEFIVFNGVAGATGDFALFRSSATGGALPLMGWDVMRVWNDHAFYYDNITTVANTWYHIAITRDSNNMIRVFQNGISLSGTSDFTGGTAFSGEQGFLTTDNFVNPSGLIINSGYAVNHGGDFHLDGLRIVRDVAEWCSNFTIPTSSHTCSIPAPGVCVPAGASGASAAPSSEDSGVTVTTHALTSGVTDYYYWHLEDISKRAVSLTAPTSHANYHAWSYTQNGSEVDLYVIDTGVNSVHPMLQSTGGGSRVRDVPGYAGMDDGAGSDTNEPPTNTSLPNSTRGHGTYCALLAGGGSEIESTVGGKHGPGIAKELNIWRLRVMSEAGTILTSDMVTAINAVVAHNTITHVSYKATSRPSIINFSLGLSIPDKDDPRVYEDIQGARSNAADAVEDALKQAAFGVTGSSAASPIHIVVAAGNGFYAGVADYNGPMEARYNYGRTSQLYSTFDGTGTATFATSDANNDSGQGLTISSGATRQTNKQGNKELETAHFTNYGSAVTIFAPGEGLLCPDWDWTASFPGLAGIGNFQTGLDGTSFSSPITAGLLALRLSNKTSETPTATKAWLVDSTTGAANADQIGGVGQYSNGFMIPVGITGTAGGNGPLRFVYSSSNVTLVVGTHSLVIGDKIQISGVTETPTSGTTGTIWPGNVTKEQAEGWHTITSTGVDNVVFQITGLYPSDNASNVGGTATVKYAKVTGTHEARDGVEYHSSTLQLVPNSGSNVNIAYTPVTYSDNLYLYNPYQKYATSWTQSSSLAPGASGSAVSLTFSAAMTISNSISGSAPASSVALNETPFPCALTFDSGVLPTGLSYDTSTGVLSGTASAVGTYTFTIAATNGYWNAKRQFVVVIT